MVAAVLAFCAFLMVLATNRTTILLSLPAVVIAGVYPFFKRFFALPQAFLGIAFSFGIPMAFAAVLRRGAGARLVAAASSTCSGWSPTTPSTRWSTATTT